MAEDTVLIVGASRGLGYAMAAEFVKKGWRVVGTVREGPRTALHDLADANKGRVTIEHLDVCEAAQLEALHARLSGQSFSILFVNAGISNDPRKTIGDVETDEFVRVMATNALGPMRVIEKLAHLVADTGLIGAMSSVLGSVASNETGSWEAYRASKAALNMLMRSFAARHSGSKRSMVLMAPGWVRTDMGGPQASLSIEESVPNLVTVLLSKRGEPGLRYLDYLGRTVPW
jgi:NAD(P)-dependent dehydrogenase (short-subunit alcohol dehydrogenase family)